MIFHYFNAGQIIAIVPIDLSQIVSFISNSSLCCLFFQSLDRKNAFYSFEAAGSSAVLVASQ
jgi:hypothetical protein